MQKELYDIEITFEGKAPVVVAGLTHEQMAQLQGVFKSASGGREWRLAHVHWPQPLTGWIDGAWRKLNAWMMPLLLIAVLGGAALAQDKLSARAVEPVRVEISVVEGDDASQELKQRIHDALRANRAVVFPTQGRLDYSITLAADTLDSSTGCSGVVGGMVAVDRSGRPRVLIYTGRDLAALAETMAEAIAARFSQLRRK